MHRELEQTRLDYFDRKERALLQDKRKAQAHRQMHVNKEYLERLWNNFDCAPRMLLSPPGPAALLLDPYLSWPARVTPATRA